MCGFMFTRQRKNCRSCGATKHPQAPMGSRTKHFAKREDYYPSTVLDAVKRTLSFSAAAKEFYVSREAVRKLINKHYPDFNLYLYRDITYKDRICGIIEDNPSVSFYEISIKADISYSTVKRIILDFCIEHKGAWSRGEKHIGEKFGEWTAIRAVYKADDGRFYDTPQKNASVYLVCKCSCRFQSVKKVSLSNLLSGASTRCRKCARNGNPEKLMTPVENLKTGEIYPSIKDAAATLNIPRKLMTYRLDIDKGFVRRKKTAEILVSTDASSLPRK